MRKKSLSLLELPDLQKPKINYVRRQSDLISPDLIQNRNFFSGLPCPPARVPSRIDDSIQLKKSSLNQNLSCKNISEVDEEILKTEKYLKRNLNTIQECREMFTEIIKSNQKYSKVLSKIKEVYEENLLKNSKEKSKPRSQTIKNSTKKPKKPKNLSNSRNSPSVPSIPSIPSLPLQKIPKSDYHSEFMSNFKNFSESWRKLIIK
jgi:hypothetical protein